MNRNSNLWSVARRGHVGWSKSKSIVPCPAVCPRVVQAHLFTWKKNPVPSSCSIVSQSHSNFELGVGYARSSLEAIMIWIIEFTVPKLFCTHESAVLLQFEVAQIQLQPMWMSNEWGDEQGRRMEIKKELTHRSTPIVVVVRVVHRRPIHFLLTWCLGSNTLSCARVKIICKISILARLLWLNWENLPSVVSQVGTHSNIQLVVCM